MAGLADWLEDYRNWRGRQEWEQGKGWQDFFGGDPRAQEQFEKLSGFGTDAGGLVGMIKASHGSPHMFDKFDFTKIGTGEGAQAYGHGGYFAHGFDSPVAQEYQKRLSENLGATYKFPSGETYQITNPDFAIPFDDVMKDPKTLQNWTKTFENDAPEIIEAANILKRLGVPSEKITAQNPGHLYNVELRWPDAAREAADPLGEHHLLDWFEPLSKQSEHVKKSLRDYATLSGKEHYVPEWSDVPVYIGEGISPDTKGKEFYEWLASQPLDIKGLASRDLASGTLKAFDVPGIKYLDEGSRGAGKGTRNYVMFDDALANIVSRNGVSLSDLLRR